MWETVYIICHLPRDNWLVIEHEISCQLVLNFWYGVIRWFRYLGNLLKHMFCNHCCVSRGATISHFNTQFVSTCFKWVHLTFIGY